MSIPNTQDPRVISKRTSNALERLDQVEKVIAQIVSGVNNSLGGLSQQVGSQGSVLEAVVQLLGKDAVETTMKEIAERRAQETMEAEKKAMLELVTRGDVAAVEKVTDKSIIVGREFNPDGTLRSPGRAQVAFQRVDEAFKANLLGQTVGFIMDLPAGGKFEVMEIYEVVEKDITAPQQAPVTPEVVA